MDPYKAPETNLDTETINTPKNIILAYYFIGLSFCIFLVEEVIFAASSESGIFDIFNYIFVPIWAGVLYWVTLSIRNRKSNPKATFLILAILVTILSIYDPLGAYSIYTGLAESFCFLIAFYFLNKNGSSEWFHQNA